MKIDVILPAGGRIGGQFAAEAGTEIKALISIGGQSVLERTIAALRDTGRIGSIVVIGPEELQAHPAASLADAVLPEGASGPENIFRGLEWLREEWLREHPGGLKEHLGGEEHLLQTPAQSPSRVLILTTDLPFITPSAIAGFLDACPSEADVCVPIIERAEFEACFPHAPNFYLRLRDGEWTLGCAFLLHPEAILKHRLPIEHVFAARKSPIRMARLLGPLFIVRLLTRRLTVNHIAQRCERILGCTGAVVLGGAPELAYDVDLLEEYRYALERSRP